MIYGIPPTQAHSAISHGRSMNHSTLLYGWGDVWVILPQYYHALATAWKQYMFRFSSYALWRNLKHGFGPREQGIKGQLWEHFPDDIFVGRDGRNDCQSKCHEKIFPTDVPSHNKHHTSINTHWTTVWVTYWNDAIRVLGNKPTLTYSTLAGSEMITL